MSSRRTSRKFTRSFNACHGCKQRKIKCDEAEPNCHNCVSRKQICTGPRNKGLRWSATYESPSNANPISPGMKIRKSQPQSSSENAVCLSALTSDNQDVPEAGSSGPPRSATTSEQLSLLPEIIPWDVPDSGTDFQVPGQLGDEPQLEAASQPGLAHTPTLSSNSTTHLEDPNLLQLGLMSQLDFDFCLLNQDFPSSTETLQHLVAAQPDSSNSLNLPSTYSSELPTTSHQTTQQSQTDDNLQQELDLSELADPKALQDSQQVLFAEGYIHTQDMLSTIPAPMLHLPTLLVEFYFRDVCSLFSSYDSQLNPFRSKILLWFPHSPLIYCSIQSMAAAKMADDMPFMKSVALHNQKKAKSAIVEELSKLKDWHEASHELIFAMLMVGLSSSWHDSTDLGFAHLPTFRKLIHAKLLESSHTAEYTDNNFLQGALQYWEMIAHSSTTITNHALLREVDIVDTSCVLRQSKSSQVRSCRIPHPWTGVVPEAMLLWGRTTALIRQLKYSGTTSRNRVEKVTNIIEAIEMIEHNLWQIEMPPVHEIAEVGDPNTPGEHQLLLFESTISIALLQVYEVFPHLLRRIAEAAMQQHGHSTLAESKPSPFHYKWALSLRKPCHQDRLKALAIHAVECIEQIPLTSGTKVGHAFTLIAASSGLRLSHPAVIRSRPSYDLFETASMESIYTLDDRIRQCRRFTTERLLVLRSALRFEPLKTALFIVDEIWRRLDAGDEALWIDVMDEMNGWAFFN